MPRPNLLPRTVEEYEHAAREYCRALPLEHFMESITQATQREITLESLALVKARRADVHVLNELLVQYPHDGGFGQVVPDNMVVLSAQPLQAQGSFNLPFELARPLWVLEYVSASSARKDYEESFQKYEQELRVPYCLLFYPERQDLQVHRLRGRNYRRLKPNAAGRFAIAELELEVGLRDGWVRFWYQGQLLELPAEMQQRLDEAQRQAEQAQRQTEQARQQARREKRRAEREKEQRLAAEAEAQRLRALLDRLQRGE